jgi:hypothetical protein
MATYSHSFLSASIPPSTVGPLRPPAGFIWVVRSIDCFTDVDGFSSCNLFVEDETAGNTWFWFTKSITDIDPRGYFSWRGRQVFDDGGFNVKVTGAPIDVRISGYKLTA